MWAGKQKAWMAALGVLLTGVVSMFFGSGEGPTPEQVTDFTSISGEIFVWAIGSGVTWFITYAKANVNEIGQKMTFGGK